MQKKTQQILFKVLQAIISLGLIAWVLSRVSENYDSISLTNCSWNWVWLAFGVQACILLQMTLRWKVLLLSEKSKKPAFKDVTYFLMLGYFYSSFLPFSFAGDVIRSLAFAKHTGDLADSASSAIMSRFLGVLMLFSVFGIAYIFLPAQTLPDHITLSVALLMFVFFSIFFLTLYSNWYILLKKMLPEKITKIFEPISIYKNHKIALSWAAFWSFLIQLFMIIMYYFLYRAVGVDINFFTLMLCLPLIIFMVFLPISISGIGVREAGSIWLLGQYAHIPEAQILQVSILSYFITYGLAIFGGIWMFFRKEKTHA